MVRNSIYALFLCAAVCFFPAPASVAEEEISESGNAVANFRFRIEHVNDDAFDSDALAPTVRFRLKYSSGEWNHWTGFAEFDYVEELFTDHYNSGEGTSSSDRDGYPVVADPNGADLNQFHANYSGFDDWQIRLGRQRILIDDERFVGNESWRQNEQTFDAVSLGYTGWSNVRLNYHYVGQVNRIYGEASVAGRNEVNAHFINGTVRIEDRWEIMPYVYYIKNADIKSFSTNTIGVRAAGAIELGNRPLKLRVNWAEQGDLGNNPASFSSRFLSFSADWQMSRQLSVGFGAELLGGDETEAGRAFRTPLATLHKFQGWADMFLTTPDAGIEDYFIKADYSSGKWKFGVVYHDFSASDGSEQFGREIDFLASRVFDKRYTLLVKGAFFSTDSISYSDTTKMWMQVVTRF